MEHIYEEMIKRVGGHDFLIEEDGIYALTCFDNVLCKIDKNEQKASFIFGYDENPLACDSFARLACIGNKILAAPHLGDVFYLWDKEKHTVQKVDIGLRLDYYHGKYKFWQVICYEKSFYVLGYSVPVIIRIDSDTCEFECITGWVNEYAKRTGREPCEIDYFFADGFAQLGSDFYFPTSIESTLFRLNLDTVEWAFVDTDCSIRKTLNVANDGEDIWMTGYGGDSRKFAVWNVKKQMTREGMLPSGNCYYDLVFFGDYVIFFPLGNMGRIYRMNKNSLQVEIFSELDVLLEEPKSHERVYDIAIAKKNTDRITFVRRPDFTWYNYDFASKELSEKLYYIEECDYVNGVIKMHYDHIYSEIRSENGYFRENQISLEEFCKRV